MKALFPHLMFRHCRRGGARGVVAIFFVLAIFLHFSAFLGRWIELFDKCNDSIQEAITCATATTIYVLRILSDS